MATLDSNRVTGVSQSLIGSESVPREYIDTIRPPLSSSSFLTGQSNSTWNLRTSGVSASLTNIFSGNNSYLTVGNSVNLLAYSTDLISWSLRTSSLSENPYVTINSALSYNQTSGNYLVGGLSPTSTWSLRTTGFPVSAGTLSGLLYNPSETNNPYVTASNGPEFGVSTDGISWTLRTFNIGPFATNGAYSGSFGNGLYVYCGFNGSSGQKPPIITSTDTISWTLRTAAGANRIRSWFASEYAGSANFDTAGRYYVAGNSGEICSSTNGIEWIFRTSSTTANFTGSVFDGTNLIFTGNGGAIVSSTNGISWVLRTSGTLSNIPGTSAKGISYFSGLDRPYLFTTSGGGIAVSTDLIAWTFRTSGVSTALYHTSYSSDAQIYYAVGASGVSLFSTDDIVWSIRTTNTTNPILNLINVSGTFIAGGGSNTLLRLTQSEIASGSSFIATSTDSISWVTRTSPSLTYDISAVSSDGQQYVASFVDTTSNLGPVLSVSSDGIVWNLRTSGFGTTRITGIAYGSGEIESYVIVGNGGTLASSTDTIAWTFRTSGFGTSNFNFATYQNNNYFIGGQGPSLGYSTDAISWTVSNTSSGVTSIANIVYGTHNQRFTPQTLLYYGIFATPSSTGELYSSTDLIVWSSETTKIPAATKINSITSNYGYVAVSGNSGSLSTNYFQFPSLSWTQTDSNVSDSGNTYLRGSQEFTSPGNQTFYVHPNASLFYIELVHLVEQILLGDLIVMVVVVVLGVADTH